MNFSALPLSLLSSSPPAFCPSSSACSAANPSIMLRMVSLLPVAGRFIVTLCDWELGRFLTTGISTARLCKYSDSWKMLRQVVATWTSKQVPMRTRQENLIGVFQNSALKANFYTFKSHLCVCEHHCIVVPTAIAKLWCAMILNIGVEVSK